MGIRFASVLAQFAASMARFLSLDPCPHHAALQWLASSDLFSDRSLVLTPSRLAARALGVPHQSLSQWASKTLESAGWAIASPLKGQSLFRQVLQTTIAPADLLGTARTWLPTVRSLLQSSPTLPNPETVSLRAQPLIRVAQAFQAALHSERLLDPSEIYWQAIAHLTQPQTVLIYGYSQPRRDELAWINAFAADRSGLCLPVSPTPLFQEVQQSVDWLIQQGWQPQAIAPRQDDPLTLGEQVSQYFLGEAIAHPNSPAPVTHAYGTLTEELRGTLAQVKQLLHSGVPAQQVAIVTGDEATYGPILIDLAWEYGVPLRALYDTPILSTRLGAWLRNLVDVINAGWPFELTATLLSHPLCSNPDSGFWATVRSQHPVGFQPWQAIAHHHLNLDLSKLAHLKQSRRRDDWVEQWQNLFQLFDLRKRCARWARESIAFNTLDNSLVELSKPEAEILSWSEFHQELRDVLSTLTVPAQPGRGGVELHKPTSLVGSRYAHVFVVGMVEGVLPATVQNDPVLDFFERQQLQRHGICLPTAAELARRESITFNALLQTVTQQITFSFAWLCDRQEQLPSPYLKVLNIVAIAPPIHPAASPEEVRRQWLRQEISPEISIEDPVLIHARHCFAVEVQRENDVRPDEYDGILGIPLDVDQWTFSVSQLLNLGQCPFKWFSNKLLNLGAPSEIEDDLSPGQVGQLYHRVLELVLQQVQDHSSLDLAESITLSSLLTEAFAIAEKELIPPSLPAWEVRRREHLRCLELVLKDPSFLPEGHVPILLEGSFHGTWHGLRVQGRIDRIDRTDQGLVLMDYKTRTTRPTGINDDHGQACIDIQLPLYQEAAGPTLFPDEPIASAYYYSIRARKPIKAPTHASQQDLPSAIARCKSYLEQGAYPVQPDKKQVACTYCEFDGLCRKGDRLSRKENWHGTD